MNKHRVKFTVYLTCQGQLMDKTEYDSLIRALWHYAKNVRKYGKYGTMRFDLKAWQGEGE